MAESKNNVITQGLSGTIGNTVVFKQRGGKTIVANMPKKSTKDPSTGQVETRTEFTESVIYGKTAIKDPVVKAIYQSKAKGGQSAFNVAVADFFHIPTISNIDTSAYLGKKGDRITMRVTDDVMVTGVQVTIENADGSLLEQGSAVAESNGLDYTYTATADNPKITGCKVLISATDMPDNVAKAEVTL